MKRLLKVPGLTEIFRFIVAGGTSFLVDYFILYALTEFFGVYYLVSSTVSFTLSVVVNYLICVLWVFGDANAAGIKSKVLFLLSSVIGLGLNQIIMWLLVDQTGLNYLLAKAAATVIVMGWNYFAKRKIVYIK